MRTINSVNISADLPRIFKLAAEVEMWPMYLAHYRWVTSSYDEGQEHIVEMAAKRSGIPVKWTSIQEVYPSEARIFYEHIRGLTKGMRVEWRLEQLGDIVRVSIIHDLTLTVPIVSTSLGKWVVGEIFVKNIADKTLRGIKAVAEGKRHVE